MGFKYINPGLFVNDSAYVVRENNTNFSDFGYCFSTNQTQVNSNAYLTVFSSDEYFSEIFGKFDIYLSSATTNDPQIFQLANSNNPSYYKNISICIEGNGTPATLEIQDLGQQGTNVLEKLQEEISAIANLLTSDTKHTIFFHIKSSSSAFKEFIRIDVDGTTVINREIESSQPFLFDQIKFGLSQGNFVSNIILSDSRVSSDEILIKLPNTSTSSTFEKNNDIFYTSASGKYLLQNSYDVKSDPNVTSDLKITGVSLIGYPAYRGAESTLKLNAIKTSFDLETWDVDNDSYVDSTGNTWSVASPFTHLAQEDRFGTVAYAMGAAGAMNNDESYELGGADFTIEGWFKIFVFNPDWGTLFYLFYPDGEIFLGTTGELGTWNLHCNSLTEEDFTLETQAPFQEWFHVAMVYQHDIKTLSLYVNGTKIFGQVLASALPRVSCYSTNIFSDNGTIDSATADHSNCEMATEIRISDGIARYTLNFTATFERFVVDEYTRRLCHFVCDGRSTTEYMMGDTLVDETGKQWNCLQRVSTWENMIISPYCLLRNKDWSIMLGGEDFTIEFDIWFRYAPPSFPYVLFLFFNEVESQWFQCTWYNSSTLQLAIRMGSSVVMSCTAAKANYFSRFAICYSHASSQIKSFINGVSSKQLVSSGKSLSASTFNFNVIGSDENFSAPNKECINQGFDSPAHIANLRVSSGIQRYNTQYNVDDVIFDVDEYTELLLLPLTKPPCRVVSPQNSVIKNNNGGIELSTTNSAGVLYSWKENATLNEMNRSAFGWETIQ